MNPWIGYVYIVYVQGALPKKRVVSKLYCKHICFRLTTDFGVGRLHETHARASFLEYYNLLFKVVILMSDYYYDLTY